MGKKIYIYIYIQDPYRNPMKFNLTAVLGDFRLSFKSKVILGIFGIFLEGVRPKRTGICSDQMGVEAVELED